MPQDVTMNMWTISRSFLSKYDFEKKNPYNPLLCKSTDWFLYDGNLGC